ncbi:nitroreductase family protein [Geothermobacter hydrogeniphilus]|uniref:Ferridoxin n=1 Tax=Geothermobacter hydrogeniphilus TaxID=1969733 RepID=A0A1X0Y2E0_9BACT|nr:nitroreductase family protein [Geothermobacter hydrogeniphilus]ORJ59268.1 ferridoxin [Geothermobacter hydrogeniphilus]
MPLITVNQQTCNRDGLCSSVCPMKIIAFGKGAYPAAVARAEEFCIRCGHCVAVCPTGSLRHAELPLEGFPPLRKDLQLSEEQSRQFLRGRRSVRNYRDQPVSRDSLQKLIETARYAPSGHNSQGAEWLVVDNREELNRMSGIVADWMRWMLDNMADLARSLHMDRVLERIAGGEDVILRGAPALIIAHAPKDDRLASSTCTIALAYLELAASGMALGTCWAGYFNAAATSFPPLQEALALPEGHQSFGAMMVGYPQYRYHRLPTRKAPVITWR